MSEENGKLAELLELKRKYRQDCADLETSIQQRLASELEDKKKALADKFAEDLATAIAQRLKPLLREVLTNE